MYCIGTVCTILVMQTLYTCTLTSSVLRCSPKLCITASSSEEEMKLSERNLSLWRLYQIWFFLFDFYLFYQIYQISHPSESWSNTSKTCLIFLLARIRVAIMERNSFNSIVPFLSWKNYSSDHKRPTHFLMAACYLDSLGLISSCCL